jgi:LacI family transcriptional regulator
MLFTSPRQPSREAALVNTIRHGLIDGLLLVVPFQQGSYLDILREQDFPYIIIDQPDSSGRGMVVEATNWQGGYDATTYLLALGHRRIGVITGRPGVQSTIDRFEGYKAALAEHHIAFDNSLVVEGDFVEEKGYLAAKQLLKLELPPTAIFALNDGMAIGAMEAVREVGLDIPGDISIVGFDDIPQASITYPKLTTVRQPLEQMGRVAVKLLLEQVKNPGNLRQQTMLETQLIIRDSCHPPVIVN